MTKVMPQQSRSRTAQAGRASRRGVVVDLTESAAEETSAVPSTGHRPGRQRSEDVEQMLIELTRRAPTPAVGPSHWWG
jgi:hypothetical protein